MKAAILKKLKEPIVIEDIPIPEIGSYDVLVKTEACGICGTDIHIMDGWGYCPDLPFVMGHEPSGIVAEIGKNVTRFDIGDRVLPNIFFTCGYCFYCRTNRETQCINLDGILGVLKHSGGYGEYFRIPERQLFHLPEEISFNEGAVIADAVVTAVHAVERGKVTFGESVLVIGMGGCGSAVSQICKLYGATVIGLDVSKPKVEHSEAMGIKGINAREPNVKEKILELTSGNGVDCVIDTVGNVETLRTGVDSLRRGGRLVILGYTQEKYLLDPRLFAVHELEIIGTRSGGRQSTNEAMRLVANPQWKPIVTNTFPIEEVNDALKLMREGGAMGRIVLTF